MSFLLMVMAEHRGSKPHHTKVFQECSITFANIPLAKSIP